jgi:predicted RNase H-like nuclease
MNWVAGVDGCHAGWFVILREAASQNTRYKLGEHIPEVLDLPEVPKAVAIDIPIGLLETAERGGRGCDRRARELLGQPRARSIFSPPIRPVLRYSTDYKRALLESRRSSPDSIGISKQCFCLFDKIQQMDKWIDAERQKRVREVHPELCFFEMNRRRPMSYGKKDPRGLKERRDLLSVEGFDGVIKAALRETLRGQVAENDILDACAACWTAERILRGVAVTVPDNPMIDCKGLRMEMLC